MAICNPQRFGTGACGAVLILNASRQDVAVFLRCPLPIKFLSHLQFCGAYTIELAIPESLQQKTDGTDAAKIERPWFGKFRQTFWVSDRLVNVFQINVADIFAASDPGRNLVDVENADRCCRLTSSSASIMRVRLACTNDILFSSVLKIAPGSVGPGAENRSSCKPPRSGGRGD